MVGPTAYRSAVRIVTVTDRATLESGAHLFDAPPLAEAADRFLGAAGHHLLFALAADGTPVGFVSGVELVHPDKGAELYLNELGVAAQARGRGVGTALVLALAEVARANGCYGLWGVTEPDNDSARATYRRSGGTESAVALFAWEF